MKQLYVNEYVDTIQIDIDRQIDKYKVKQLTSKIVRYIYSLLSDTIDVWKDR